MRLQLFFLVICTLLFSCENDDNLSKCNEKELIPNPIEIYIEFIDKNTGENLLDNNSFYWQNVSFIYEYTGGGTYISEKKELVKINNKQYLKLSINNFKYSHLLCTINGLGYFSIVYKTDFIDCKDQINEVKILNKDYILENNNIYHIKL